MLHVADRILVMLGQLAMLTFEIQVWKFEELPRRYAVANAQEPPSWLQDSLHLLEIGGCS